ncbi:MAG: indolepyruvate oxidoreductase subunit beta [Oscillospiraceae bacterium]|nr:indolepyruvate oxidoreductase subunit beta [Oscillospiraceae bacterium]
MDMDILVCGVGGQGTVLASKLIASAAMSLGNTVHSAETIGMAQRGGSVTSHIRIGDNAYSPLIPLGSADVIIAFEPAEAVRNLMYLKKDGFVIVNRIPVKPTTESIHETGYDGVEMIEYIKKKCGCLVVDASELCGELGGKFYNSAILGAAAGTGRLGISPEALIAEIEGRVPEKFIEANKKVFSLGLKQAENFDL